MVVSLDELDQHRPHGQVLPWRVEGRDSDRQHRSGCHGDGWGTPSCVVGANTCTPVGGLLRCEIQIGQRARVVVRVHGFVQRLVATLAAAAFEQVAADEIGRASWRERGWPYV